jgi:lipopolysaccharide transport system ATP-binding protein
MSDVAIRVEGLGKRYRIGAAAERHDNVRDALTAAVMAPLRNLIQLRRLSRFDAGEAENIVWALNDVSFDVKHGEVLGIIGRNGAGKSTLLKVLSRITEPTTGRVQMHGRVGALLEVGTGFHPELTGRENVYLNGSILGMDKRYIDSKFAEIVEFSGVERFIDTPVKRYSSGMYLRLAFSVAAHLEPEILVVDEVLAVGDAEFQKKCLGKMGEVAGDGRTVLFVSHNLAAVDTLCTTAMVLSGGNVVAQGAVPECLAVYAKSIASHTVVADLEQRQDRRGSGAVRMTEFWMEDQNRNHVDNVWTGMPSLRFKVRFANHEQHQALRLLLGVYNNHNQRVLAFGSDGAALAGVAWPSNGVLECEMPEPLSLSPGTYRVNAALFVAGELADHIPSIGVIDVHAGVYPSAGMPDPSFAPLFHVAMNWSLEG